MWVGGLLSLLAPGRCGMAPVTYMLLGVAPLPASLDSCPDPAAYSPIASTSTFPRFNSPALVRRTWS